MMKAVRFVALLLMIIGSINWGLVGLFKYDVVAEIFGAKSGFTKFIYDLIGLAGLYGLAMLVGCRKCGCGCGPHCKCQK